jgi:hypothetical protein
MKTKGRPKKPNGNIFYIRLPEDLAAKVREDADREKRDLTATIELIIEQHYEKAHA